MSTAPSALSDVMSNSYDPLNSDSGQSSAPVAAVAQASAPATPSTAPPSASAPAFSGYSQPAASDSGAASQPAPTSRLGAILGAVAKTVSTGLAGIPDKGRPS